MTDQAVVPVIDQSSPAVIAQHMRDYATKATSARTQAIYRSALADFRDFCAKYKLSALPATPDTVSGYIAFLAQSGMKTSTLNVRVSAIAKAHRLAKHPDPTDDEGFKAVFAGIRRAHGTAPHKKAPITLDVLKTLIGHLPDSPAGIRDRALLLVDYGGVFRRSELAALNVQDVSIKGNHMTIVVRRGKTDQEGHGLTKHFPMLKNEDLCPLRATLAWLELSGLTTGPLFVSINKWGDLSDRRLSDHAINAVIKAAVRRAGLAADDYAGHSMRSGGITEMLQADVSQFKVMDQSGHRDVNTLRGYDRDAGTGATEAVRAAFGEKKK